MSWRRALGVASGLAVAGLFVWLFARQVEAEALWAAFAGTSSGWVAVGVAAFFLGYAARIARWRRMLALENPDITWGACAGPFFVSIAANNLLPFRAGDALRAFAFRRRLGVDAGPVLATLIVERLLDLLTLLAVLAGALLLTGLDVSGILGLGLAGLLAVAGGVLAALLAPGLLEPLPRAVARAVGRLAPGIGAKLETLVARIFTILKALGRGRAMGPLLAWSGLAWALEGGVFVAAALALPALVEPAAAWLALPVGTLATLIPSTPGHIGTFDFFVAEAVKLVGEAPAAAAAYALLVHAMIWLPPTLAGGVALALAPPRPRPEPAP